MICVSECVCCDSPDESILEEAGIVGWMCSIDQSAEGDQLNSTLLLPSVGSQTLSFFLAFFFLLTRFYKALDI